MEGIIYRWAPFVSLRRHIRLVALGRGLVWPIAVRRPVRRIRCLSAVFIGHGLAWPIAVRRPVRRIRCLRAVSIGRGLARLVAVRSLMGRIRCLSIVSSFSRRLVTMIFARRGLGVLGNSGRISRHCNILVFWLIALSPVMAEAGSEVLRQVFENELAVVDVGREVRLHGSCIVSESKEKSTRRDSREGGRHGVSE